MLEEVIVMMILDHRHHRRHEQILSMHFALSIGMFRATMAGSQG